MHELTPRPRTCPAPHPLEDGVLVRRHARPNLRWRDRGVIVGVVVVLVQVLDGFFRELPVQVRRPFPWGRSWLRGRGRGQQGSRRGRLDRDAPPFLASGLQGQWPPAAWSLSCWQTDLRGALGGLFTASPSHCGKLSPKPPDTPWLTRAAPGSAGLQARVTGPGSTGAAECRPLGTLHVRSVVSRIQQHTVAVFLLLRAMQRAGLLPSLKTWQRPDPGAGTLLPPRKREQRWREGTSPSTVTGRDFKKTHIGTTLLTSLCLSRRPAVYLSSLTPPRPQTETPSASTLRLSIPLPPSLSPGRPVGRAHVAHEMLTRDRPSSQRPQPRSASRGSRGHPGVRLPQTSPLRRRALRWSRWRCQPCWWELQPQGRGRGGGRGPPGPPRS